MLRIALLTIGALLLAAAVAASFIHREAAIPFAIFGALLLLATLFERHVYKTPLTDHPGPQWRPTGERFIDPTSGETIEVFSNPITSERRYVSRGGGAAK